MRERGTASVDAEEINKLPYLKHIPRDGRIVPIQTYYDHQEKQWRIWVVPDGKLQELKVADLFHGTYVSDKPVSPDRDHRMPFAETVLKHFCTPALADRMHQASQDLINCLGYIEKYFILLHHAKQYPRMNATALLQVELEGLFGVHRSFYDLLQRIVNEVHGRHSTQKVNLPDSFRKVAQREPNELQEKYHFPPALVQFYQEKKGLFFACRQIRDNIFHHGHSLSSVFRFDDGFAVPIDEKPWTNLTSLVNLWPEGRVRNNRLGCVLVVYALLAEDMFKTMARLGDAILASFQEPPKACFDANVYLRTHFARHLHRLDEYEQQQWITPESALPELTDELQQSPSAYPEGRADAPSGSAEA